MAKVTWLILLGMVVLCAGGKADDPVEEDDVLVLTASNFGRVVHQNEFILVHFYTPWCGECKNFAGEFSRTARLLKHGKNKNHKIPLAKVNAETAKNVATEFGVNSYPTLIMFVNGHPWTYDGNLTHHDLHEWVKKKVLPPSVEVQSPQAAADLIAGNDVVVIYFGHPYTPEFDAYIAAAREFEDVHFGHTAHPGIASQYSISDPSTPKIVLFKKFEEGRADFDGKFTLEEIKMFIEVNEFPQVMIFDSKAARKIFSGSHPCLFLFHEDDEKGRAAVDSLTEAVEALSGHILIARSSVREGYGQRLAEHVGITEKDVPVVMIIDPGHGQQLKYLLEREINTESILQFYEDWANKRLTEVYKSEDPPLINDGPVKIVVGHTFHDIVFDQSKDVLVFFYAPWSTESKEYLQIYETIANKMKRVPNLVLAKMNSIANDAEGFHIAIFPTIKFFTTKDKNSPIDFRGERNEIELTKFIREHLTVSWFDPNPNQK